MVDQDSSLTRMPGARVAVEHVSRAYERALVLAAQRGEREAVLDNLGLGGIPPWLKLTIGVVAALVVIGAVVALVALN